MDKTGLRTVQRSFEILVRTGKHQVQFLNSGVRGINTTCIYYISAAGKFEPNMAIFEWKRMIVDVKRLRPRYPIVQKVDEFSVHFFEKAWTIYKGRDGKIHKKGKFSSF